jgi:hypothetical protein
MPDRHASPMLGWHPPAELSAWARQEAAKRGVRLSVILTEALSRLRASLTPDPPKENGR